jgi:hypothetical protein
MNLLDKYRARLNEVTPANDPIEKTLELVHPSSNPKAAESVTRDETGEIESLVPCPVCHEYAWWVSKYGVLRCGVCHPPATSGAVKKWIGDRDILNRMKANKESVLLSWEEIRNRRNKVDHEPAQAKLTCNFPAR